MKDIPALAIDLELEPEERWGGMPADFKKAAARLVKQQVDTCPKSDVLGSMLRAVTRTVKNPYREDMKMIARYASLKFEHVLLANFAYELAMAYHASIDYLEELQDEYPRVTEFFSKWLGVEIGCTSGMTWRKGIGMVHLRALDWPMKNLGKNNLVSYMLEAPAGDFYSIGFPGFVGVLTGMAPGRFSASINYAVPVKLPSLTQWPPSHLLRHVFEQCESYDEAVATLLATPTGTPALISIAGTKKNEAAIIECKGGGDNIFHPMTRSKPIAIANDYLSANLRAERNGLSCQDIKPGEYEGESRDVFEAGRRDCLLHEMSASSGISLRSLLEVLNTPPVLNDCTKLQVAMCARTGEMSLYGVENCQRVSFWSNEA